jgi:hypothetical protein
MIDFSWTPQQLERKAAIDDQSGEGLMEIACRQIRNSYQSR